MTKITKLEPKTYQGKINGYKVELSDGTTGYLNDKGSDNQLQVGENVTVSVEQKMNKKNEPYNLLTLKRDLIYGGATPPTPAPHTPPTAPPQSFKPTTQSSDIQKAKIEAAIRVYEAVMDAYKAERIDYPKVAEIQREGANLLWSEIDEIFRGA